MKADRIIKNAKIFTADKKNPKATSLVVKDGKFIYVGDESGLSEYEGEAIDLGGKFIMPAIIDSHVHVTIPVGFEYAEPGERIEPNGKKEALNIMAKYVKENPGLKRYRFLLEKKFLSGEDIVKEGLAEVSRLHREYNTEHLKVHTMKIFMDGTQKIHTAYSRAGRF